MILTDRAVDVSDDSLFTTFIGSDFVEEGRRAGNWVVKATGGKGNIVELQGTPGSAPAIDRWYEVARASGALGGKLVGAGAGGFLMLYAGDPDAVRHAMSNEGLRELRFMFDHDGSTVTARDP